MAQKKPETLLRDEVLRLMDDGSAADFNAAFAIVMHARGIFHRNQPKIYNSWFRKIRPLVTTALNARKIKAQRAASPRKKPCETTIAPFAELFQRGQLSGFTEEPAE